MNKEVDILAIYVLLLLWIMICGYMYSSGKIRKKTFIILCYLAFSVLGACRDVTVGTDTGMYDRFFRAGVYTGRFENGFLILCRLLSKISSSTRILLITTSTIANAGYMYFIYKNTDRIIEACLIYVFMNFYFDTYNLMRQELAVSIMLVAITMLCNKKYIKFLLLWLLACQFHNSCYIYMVCPCLYMLYKRIKNMQLKVVFTVLVIVFVYVLTPLVYNKIFSNGALSSNYYYYQSSVYVERNTFGSALMTLLYCIVLLYAISQRKRLMSLMTVDKIEYYFASLCCSIVFYSMAIQVEIFSRFVHYFTPVSIILISDAIPKANKRRAIIERFVIYSIIILYWCIIIIFRPTWHGAVPYKFMH